MKSLKKWRYYCDFCGKSGGSKYHMLKHEKHCTKNPNRICRICYTAQLSQQTLDDLRKAFNEGGMNQLRQTSENCPMCILATIRSYLPTKGTYDPEFNLNFEGFDFKKELKEFWDEHNQEAEYY